MKKLFLLFAFTSLLFTISAQTKKMDSLKVALRNATQDTARLRIYIALCNECDLKDNLKYAEPATKLADKLLSEIKNETERKKILNQKALFLNCFTSYYLDKEGSSSNKALEYYQKQLLIYKEMEYGDNIRNAIEGMADIYGNQGNILKKLETLKVGLSNAQKAKNKNDISIFISWIGFLYAEQGDTVQAMDYFEKGLQNEKEIGDTSRIAKVLFIMGNFYSQIHRYSKALDCYNKSLQKYGSGNKHPVLPNLYLSIAAAYAAIRNENKEMESAQKSLSIAEEIKDSSGMDNALRFLGNYYREKNNISKAIEYHNKALKISEERKSNISIGWNCLELAQDYLLQKNCTKAQEYSKRCLATIKKSDYYWNVRDAEQIAAKVDSACGNFKEAFFHYQQYMLLRNKSNSEEIHKEALKEKFQKEYDKQQSEQDKKDELAKAESKKQKLIILFVGLGLLLVLVFLGFIFRSLRIRNKQNKIITEQKVLVEEKNREITDSISYALRIQTAILPPQKIVKQYLENSFILYKPKDIVAGDFYWMETVEFENLKMSQFENEAPKSTAFSNSQMDTFSNCILFAACDCTGHGVPGAMVSVVCHNALNRAVREYGLTQPAQILDKTAEIVIENFSKSEENIKDGMDISLVSLKFNSSNSKEVQVEWAGANNPLWIVKRMDNDTYEQHSPLSINNYQLMETKADKQPIGMNEDKKPFTNHQFTLTAGDSIYLFTDGFADQFGGETGEKKLTRKRFKELLLSIQHLPMNEQGITLDKFISDYRKEVEQIDDILVMGVRV